MKIHIVQKGDTLWKIAQKYGVQFEELKSINSQLSNPDMIMPGMKIKVPGTGNTKHAQMMQSNTKINMGSKKEAPIPSVTVSPVKEMPKQEIVSPVPIQQGPTVIKEQPKMSKEQPMPISQPMPQPAPTIPAMPQPIIPDVDINNYYMVNMANMMVQKPQPQQVQPQQVQPQPQQVQLQPKPVIVETESEESPVQVQPYPVMVDACVPITPVMPGPGFCHPVHHMYQPMYGPGPVQIQPLQQYFTEESSSMHSPQMPSWHYGEYMPVMHQQQMMPMHGGMQYNPGFVYAQAPFVSPHGLHHQIESTSHYASESSSHVIQPTYVQPSMEMQAPYQPITNVPVMEEEEDCGCGAPKLSALMDEETDTQPQYYQPQMQSWDQSQKSGSQSSMPHSQMSGSQSDMSQAQISGSQGGMYQPQMSGSQGGMYQPQMSGSQGGMYQSQMSGSQGGMYQPQMSGNQGSMSQAQMGGSQASMYQPQMSGNQGGMYQPQMSGSHGGMSQAQMSGSQPSMYQQQMGGNQPGMLQPQMSGAHMGQYQMPMQPWQQGMPQSQMNPNQSGSFMPQMRVNQPFYPMGNVPFYGQDENTSDIGQLTSYSDAFDLPRFADESNE